MAQDQENVSKKPKRAVYAAGCVVWRSTGSGPELLVVHRPRYDDWSFAKGKRDKGESDLDCALREVEEETGLSGSLGHELEPVHYLDHKDRPKVVRYWTLEVAQDHEDFVANDEVDEVQWLLAADADQVLTYAHDRALIPQALLHIL